MLTQPNNKMTMKRLTKKKRGRRMKFARMIVNGVLADNTMNYNREELLLQRAVDEGGDTVLVTSNKNDGQAHIIPTSDLKALLEKTLEDEVKI